MDHPKHGPDIVLKSDFFADTELWPNFFNLSVGRMHRTELHETRSGRMAGEWILGFQSAADRSKRNSQPHL